MSKKIQLLDCTLRDGAYIVNSEFGTPVIKGIIKRMQDANVDLIECGWLKDSEHSEGTSFFHLPSDLEKYLVKKSDRAAYVAMIDWNRYDVDSLPEYDGKSIDAVRVVFPYDRYKEGIDVGRKISQKGYKVYFQAANTLAYSDEELVSLAEYINDAKPVALSVVDTFGAMFSEDLNHIVKILDKYLDTEIKLGFHSHNNQQLSFALSMQFVEMLMNSDREIIVDASLCGMGRGAGNATTELMANYLNRKHQGNYDINIILDAIDTYMGYFLDNYSWGYSTPYFISGMYCAHVNNIAYLQKNHRTNAKDMRNIIGSLSEEERTKYDYDLLEEKFIEHQNKVVDDEQALIKLQGELSDKKILLILPGKSIEREIDKVKKFIGDENPVVIGVNSINHNYSYDYLFFCNTMRYDYAKDIYRDTFVNTDKIIASNIKTITGDKEEVVNYNLLVKRGWKHFDNSGIMCLRLLDKLRVKEVYIAGFDGFENDYDSSYADISLPHIAPGNTWVELNNEIQDMFSDFKNTTKENMSVTLLTESKYR